MQTRIRPQRALLRSARVFRLWQAGGLSPEWRTKSRDNIFDRDPVRPRRERQGHSVPEDGRSKRDDIVNRRRKAAVQKRACTGREHQGLTRAGSRSPGQVVPDFGIARFIGPAGAHQLQDGISYGIAYGNGAHESLRGRPVSWLAGRPAGRPVAPPPPPPARW